MAYANGWDLVREARFRTIESQGHRDEMPGQVQTDEMDRTQVGHIRGRARAEVERWEHLGDLNLLVPWYTQRGV